MAGTGQDLAGKVALIIGGTTGIGLATATAFRRAGAWVFVASSSQGKVDAAVAALNAIPSPAGAPPVGGIVMDAGSPQAIETGFKGLAAATGNVLDVLVYAAGILYRSPPETEPLIAWQRTLDVNLTGAFVASQRALPLLRRGASVIFVASVAAQRGLSHVTSYAVSKAGLVSLAQQLAGDWAPRGIRVNAVNPGFVPTDINRASLEGTARGAAVLARTPAGRFGTVEEIAAAIAFLASPAASFVTGTALTVDGGLSSSAGVPPGAASAVVAAAITAPAAAEDAEIKEAAPEAPAAVSDNSVTGTDVAPLSGQLA
jgi:2-deoxy-D-gluconate 3-dehydrogenase